MSKEGIKKATAAKGFYMLFSVNVCMLTPLRIGDVRIPYYCIRSTMVTNTIRCDMEKIKYEFEIMKYVTT